MTVEYNLQAHPQLFSCNVEKLGGPGDETRKHPDFEAKRNQILSTFPMF